MVRGETEFAIRNYEKSLEFNTNNTNAVQKLEEPEDTVSMQAWPPAATSWPVPPLTVATKRRNEPAPCSLASTLTY